MSMTAVAVTPQGSRFAVAWKDVRVGSPRVWWAEAAERGFERDVPLVADGKADQDHPALVLDAMGIAWIAWEEGRGDAARIRLRSSAKGDRPRDLADAAQGAPAFPVLALGPGRLVLAWEATGTDGERVFASVLDAEAR